MNRKIDNMKRGDIFYADLSPVIGCEQGGVRPVIILQNNVGNHFSPTTIVAAITARECKNNIPTHIVVVCEGLAKTSIVLLEQLRTIDKSRIGDYVGCVDEQLLIDIDKALALSIGIEYLIRKDGR